MIPGKATWGQKSLIKAGHLIFGKPILFFLPKKLVQYGRSVAWTHIKIIFIPRLLGLYQANLIRFEKAVVLLDFISDDWNPDFT